MLYLDNAATTWPKPDKTVEAITNYIRSIGVSPGRGSYKEAIYAMRLVTESRQEIASLFNVANPNNIVFTLNATEAINLALKGLLKEGDNIITSSMEHNAVMRPLNTLKKKGIEVTEIKNSADGFFNLDLLKKSIKRNTKAVVVLHASNVTGTIMPLEEIGEIAKDFGILLIVDATQTAGILDIDVDKLGIDLLAFTGHKSLYGPPGTGGLYIRSGLKMETLKEGGTGSKSEYLEQPETSPDRYESGTLNAPGIVGLCEGVKFVKSKGIESIRKHGNELTNNFIDGLSQIKNIKIYGSLQCIDRIPIVSINIGEMDCSQAAYFLSQAFDICCRSGMQCTPAAHKTIGTFPNGTLRFSFSIFNTIEDINKALGAIEQIARNGL